ncbi:DODA-type extradiol aromatic ring-opening family dioxygenase [Pollutimonas harenae]|uniref:Dioxygenase n=1 Tax=Pollutimonas harenae TaxID=657015 RepID=A0A853GME3_9BURK|nr:class III extradiol ring-cleavage dioxygenase [Pollutimonas harenae]NYT84168.1 dioxygenase [Pollutimonas harenae]TEA73416.1 dioxygenase [Pollutimonas harenae]
MSALSLAPVLFISHGAPTFALEPGRLGARLGEVGRHLEDVRAIVVVSPHWQTRDVAVGTTAAPETIHDFSGFPQALYALRYPVAGAPEAAGQALTLLSEAGWPVRVEPARGLDHGAWVPLMHMLPKANIPVFQVSLPHALDTRGAVALGQTLAPLREQGIAIVASGSMTHNLYEFRGAASQPEPYVSEFTAWVDQAVVERDVSRLADYRSLAPHAQRAHPTEEHFLPLLVAMAATGDDEPLVQLDDAITYGVLSMTSYGWGLAQAVSA